MKIDITKRFPWLIRFMFGPECPKCKSVMSIYFNGYNQCSNCGYKRKKLIGGDANKK